MGYTPTSNALQTGNFGSSGGYGGSGYTPSANPLQSRSFDPTYFKAPAPTQFKDTPQGQKFRSIFSQADQQTKAQIFNHLTNAAKAGNQRSYDQLNAIRDIVQKPTQNPVQMATSGNGLLDAVQNITRAGRDHILAPTIENVLGGGTAGETLNAQGKVTGGGHQETVKQVAFRGLADRLLIGAPGEKALGEVASKIPGVGKIASTAVQGGHQFGSFNAANSIENGDKPLNIAKSYGTGFATGAALGATGSALHKALSDVRVASSPLKNSTKLALVDHLQQAGQTDAAEAVKATKTVGGARVAIEHAKDPSIATAPVSKLTTYEGAPDRGAILGYKNAIQDGKPIEPIKIKIGSDGQLGVEDGKHRLAAYKELGFKEVPVQEVSVPKAQTDLSNFHQDFTESKNIPGEAKTPNVAQLREPGSTTLSATAVPGAKEFATQDVLPKARGAAEGIKNVVSDTKQIVTPANAGQAAHDTALAVRNYKASSANQAAIEAESGKSAFKLFNKRPDEQNIASISHFERTGQFDVAPKGQTPAEYSKLYQQTGDQAHAIKQEVYGQNGVGYINHYVRRAGIFNFRNPGEENKAVSALLSTYKSLKPSDASVKGRTLDMPLDQAVQTLKDRGVKFSLNTTNPEQLRQLTINSAIQAKGFKDLGGDLKDQNLVKFVKPGAQVPDGLVKLNDRAFQVFFPSESGLVKAGEYYAPKEVANVLNNSASQGLEQYALYRGARNIKNNFNLVQLGLSAFHAGTTTINASLNDLTLGLRDVLSGKLGSGAKELTRGAVPGVSIIRQTYLGSKAFKEFAKGSPEAAKLMEERLNPSGARLKLQAEHNTKVSQNLVKAFANGNYLGATLRAPGAIIEQSTRPIMEHLVPNAKLGAVLDRFEAVQRSMPNATDAQLKSAFAKSADSVDNIYGQLVYDNLFWNKTFKDLAMLSQRSVGWNLGTVREVGGGLTDALTKTARGKGVSDRTLFAASLPMLVGTYGAVYQYLHTGKGPETLKDYFYPKNGLTDKNGNPMRVALPSYMKDVYAYATHPIATVEHKASPLLANVLQLAQNKNYFGDMIRNPDDSVSKQLQQVGSYLLTQLQPFSVQQQQRAQKAGSSLAQQGESFIGVTQAPGDITQTKFEKNVYSVLGKQLNTGPLTPEQQAANQAKASARQQIQQGKGNAAADQLLQQGVLKDQKGEKKFVQESQATSLQRAFQGLTPANKLKVLQNTNSTDLQKLGDLGKLRASLQKTANNKKTTASNKRALQGVLAKLQ